MRVRLRSSSSDRAASLALNRVSASVPPDVTPRYDSNRNLILPDDYRRWVLVGSSLGLSYSEGRQDTHQMFNTTLMDPSAYRFRCDRHVQRRDDALARLPNLRGAAAQGELF